MDAGGKVGIGDGLHRKLRRVVALLEDLGATEHERANASIKLARAIR